MLGAPLVVVVAAYLVGTFPTAALIGRVTGHDPTAEGSGNPGATNVLRTSGRWAGAAVLAVDVAKGALAAGLGLLVGDHTLGVVSGAAAVLGHVAPVSRRFRGGKGVATAAGASAVVFPVLSLILGVVFVITVAITRRVSVGSLVLALLLPVGVALGGWSGIEVLVTAGVSLLVIARHHENIRRLIRREEAPVLRAGKSS
ncbi:MAG TPA: glycerol-3-phosphate 1-O-acyltransferase PlsY [Acidimicrobiales bacterium]